MKTEIKNPEAVWSIRGVPLDTRRAMASRARARGVTVPVYLGYLMSLDPSDSQNPSQAACLPIEWQSIESRLAALEKTVQQTSGHVALATATKSAVDLYAVISDRIRSIPGRVNWLHRAEILNAEELTRPGQPWTAHSLRAWMDRMRREYPNG